MTADEAKPLLRKLPSAPGVYRFIDDGDKTLYVGKARDIKKRVSTHFQKTRQSARAAIFLAAATRVEATITASEGEALLLENNLIKSLKPKYNILFRDDKSYPFLRLTKHAYPRLMFYRGGDGDGHCFGPFPDSAAVKHSIKVAQKLFRLRTCADSIFANRSRPCLLHSINRCSAPCVNKISPAHYAADAKSARAFLSGDVKQAATDLQRRMESAAAAEDFETATVHRDSLRALNVVRAKHFVEDDKTPDADYIGAHRDDGGDACINVVMVRGGRRIGERRFFPKNARQCATTEIMEAFLSQHYQQTPPPPKVFLQPQFAANDKREDGACNVFSACLVVARGDKNKRVQQANENARHALVLQQAKLATRRQQMESLGEKLRLPKTPRRIECFDVSHTMGEETVAARVVFVDGEAATGDYRRYGIRNSKNNDPAALQEAVLRCYRNLSKSISPSDSISPADSISPSDFIPPSDSIPLTPRRTNSLTPRRLRGGVEICASKFPGGGNSDNGKNVAQSTVNSAAQSMVIPLITGISSDESSTQNDSSSPQNESSFLRRRESVESISATPQKSPGDFYPPPQAAEGEKNESPGDGERVGDGERNEFSGDGERISDGERNESPGNGERINDGEKNESPGDGERVDDTTDAPDLLLIDGGVGQLHSVARALAILNLRHLPLVAIAKGAARKAGCETLILADGETIKLSPTDSALHLLQAVRDEAHRFAVSGHRARRDKKRRVSKLEEVPGVGPKLRRILLNHFGGLGGIKLANREELVKIRGVGPQLAERLHRELR